MKYPIGIQDFAQIIQDGYVYVDKTDLVYKLATEGKIYFPTYLVRLLAHSNENINELVGKYYDASQFIDYKADVEQPYAADNRKLIALGINFSSEKGTIDGFLPKEID